MREERKVRDWQGSEWRSHESRMSEGGREKTKEGREG